MSRISGRANRIDQALRGARLIVATHEHGDHVAVFTKTPLATSSRRKPC